VVAQRFPIEAGHVLMFARAIGDHALEDAALRPGADTQLTAPPTFVQAAVHFDPDYRTRPIQGEPWIGSGKNATGLDSTPPAGGTLHAEQHYHYERPLRVGDVLTATVREGASWTKEGKRSGTLHFTEAVTEFRDAEGALVVTARGVSVRTERAVDNRA
jgi:hypothetical protein